MDERNMLHLEEVLGLKYGELCPVEFSMNIDPHTEVFRDFSVQMIRHKLFRLPYEQCLFDYIGPNGTQLSLFCWEPRVGIIDCIMLSHVHGEAFNALEIDIENDTLKHVDFGDQILRDARDDPIFSEKDKKEGDLYTFGVLCGFVGALSTRGVKETVSVPSHRANEKRAKRGMRRLPERHHVVVDVSRNAVSSEVDVTQNRCGPRPHWRRGHIRQLSSGAFVSVKPCIVAGSIAERKSYVVK